MSIPITGEFAPSGGAGAFPLYNALDINGTGGSANDILQTDGTSGGVTWKTLAAAGIAAASHTHSAADITSGTLAIARGGTGEVTAQAAIDSLSAVAGATNEYVLTKDTASGNALWKAAAGGGGGGDVVGPASATDNAIVRYDTTTGKLVQDSLATIDDVGELTTPSLKVTNNAAFSGAFPFVKDKNGNEYLGFFPTASAVTYLKIINSATGVAPIIQGVGEANTGLNLKTSGTGVVQANGVEIATISDTQTLTNKVYVLNGTKELRLNADAATMRLYAPASGTVTLENSTATGIVNIDATGATLGTINIGASADVTNIGNNQASPGGDILIGGSTVLTMYPQTSEKVILGSSTKRFHGLYLSDHLDLADGVDVHIGTTATTGGTTFGAANSVMSFFGQAVVEWPSAPTAAETTITNAGTASDYAIQAMTSTTPWGFASKAEGETLVEVVLNNQVRINEVVTALQNLGLIQ